ncbi:hypothetical protein LEP1GSC008_0981 [Leptospira kirschneri serovar Bulgarica str. Nikolaevo]|uniref:Uncharacterized protein n=1 Tax=Leptospira kirschneri serovar Bulgarica str. Nikolaevo TaxID=1240687 RepID=M6FJH0_9LEPT|nr:hypothetical protein LEP1GSC008_0981 [Leptospira kirschneri serovar Bulgarica str. Nikolaevo]
MDLRGRSNHLKNEIRKVRSILCFLFVALTRKSRAFFYWI